MHDSRFLESFRVIHYSNSRHVTNSIHGALLVFVLSHFDIEYVRQHHLQ